MDSHRLHTKVQAFAHRLLEEANGDPVRALGLLVLVLEDSELESADHAHRLVAEVRKVLLPQNFAEVGQPIQHLAGHPSWEGVQHCLRCGKVLSKRTASHEDGITYPSGYVYEVGPRFTTDDCDDFDLCQ
ncbi:MAG: hypothetical protein LZF86_50104 [Nitrospira sp.]|nr:MAG: hypothetical protein LZF86_50104 [Nitrospira sp.]